MFTIFRFVSKYGKNGVCYIVRPLGVSCDWGDPLLTSTQNTWHHWFAFIPFHPYAGRRQCWWVSWPFLKLRELKAAEILKKRPTYHASYATTSIKADVSLLRFWEQPRFDWVQRTRVWTSANFTRKFNWKGAKNQELNQEIRYSQKVGSCYQF